MIDWARIIELHDEIGADDFNEVVELFLSEVEERIDAAQTRTTPNEMAEDLHFLKGSALNLGFSQFAQLCSDGEVNANEGMTTNNLDQITNAYQNSKRTFMDNLAQHLRT